MKRVLIAALLFSVVPSSWAFAETSGEVTSADLAGGNSADGSSRLWTLVPSLGAVSLGESGDLNSKYAFSNRSTLTFGAELETRIFETVSGSIGVNYLQTGAEAILKATGGPVSFQRNYVGIPMSAKWEFAKFEKLRSSLFLTGGAYSVVQSFSS